MTDAKQKQRRQLLAMFAIAFLTLGGSYALFYTAREGGVWGTTNHGEFVQPPMTVTELGMTGTDGTALEPSWWLWVVAPGGCTTECERALFQLRQLHVLLNKDADRLRRALLADVGDDDPIFQDYPKLERLTGASGTLNEGIYLVDPLGNLVLVYSMDDAGKPVLDDLKKLLKLSQIG